MRREAIRREAWASATRPRATVPSAYSTTVSPSTAPSSSASSFRSAKGIQGPTSCSMWASGGTGRYALLRGRLTDPEGPAGEGRCSTCTEEHLARKLPARR